MEVIGITHFLHHQLISIKQEKIYATTPLVFFQKEKKLLQVSLKPLQGYLRN